MFFGGFWAKKENPIENQEAFEEKVSDKDSDKADILQHQYASMWSQPKVKYDSYDMEYFFSDYTDFIDKKVHLSQIFKSSHSKFKNKINRVYNTAS